MAMCKGCGSTIQWGFDDKTGRWVPLEPIDTHDDLPKSFVDENGEARADHRDRHDSAGTVNVHRLAKKIPPKVIEEQELQTRRTRRRKAAAS